MESFKRRLKYYGIGFGLGLIFVFFFFQNRGCSWLPSNRVKNAVLDRLIVVSEDTEEKLKEKGISTDELIGALDDGDVIFAESDKDGESKVYVIEKDGVKYAFSLPYESFISEAFVGVKDSKIEMTKEGLGTILRFPADEDLVHPDSSDVVTCQQDKLGLISPREILKLIKKSGKLDFGKCDFAERPKPLQYIVFEKDGKPVGARMIWYKNKLNITGFESELTKDCH